MARQEPPHRRAAPSEPYPTDGAVDYELGVLSEAVDREEWWNRSSALVGSPHW